LTIHSQDRVGAITNLSYLAGVSADLHKQLIRISQPQRLVSPNRMLEPMMYPLRPCPVSQQTCQQEDTQCPCCLPSNQAPPKHSTFSESQIPHLPRDPCATSAMQPTTRTVCLRTNHSIQTPRRNCTRICIHNYSNATASMRIQPPTKKQHFANVQSLSKNDPSPPANSKGVVQQGCVVIDCRMQRRRTPRSGTAQLAHDLPSPRMNV
jgi:hypothetical protein